MDGLALAEREWTTTKLHESEQFAFWRDVVWEAFVPVSLSRATPGSFTSSCALRRVGAMGISWIAPQGQQVERNEAQVSRNPGDVFFLNLPLTVGASARQDGRIAELQGGDFILIDSARPFELKYEGKFQQISVMLPHDALAPLLADPWSSTAICIRGDRGVGAVAAAAIRALATTTGSLTIREERGLSDNVVAVVASAVGGLQARTISRNRGRLLQAAIDEIERFLDNPELSPDFIAERLSISVRYLHKIFADHGVSFGRWVRARRLERAERDLRDSALSQLTVAEIAFGQGFSDSAHFARAFKAHYGSSPREHRVKASGGGDRLPLRSRTARLVSLDAPSGTDQQT